MSNIEKKLAEQQPFSKISLHVSCQQLLNKDRTSKSDPCCALYAMNHEGRWLEVGRTETIQNNLNPTFSRAFEIDYYFEMVQNVRFMLYDIDNSSEKLSDDDFLGQHECTLGEIVTNSPYIRPLFKKGNHKAGTSSITLVAQEMSQQVELLTLSFRAQNLDKKDFMGKSDPYLEFQINLPNSSTMQVMHRTEVVKNDLSPTWKTFDIRTNQLCVDYDQPIKVDCNDYDNDGSHDLIGSFNTTVRELISAAMGAQLQWQVINPKKTSKKGYKNSGVVFLSSCRVQKDYSFLDFIFSGLQLNFSVGIDFTASNGNPKKETSLHYCNPSKPNQYMIAIKEIGKVLKDYDSDQLYPALGFGAKIPPKMEVSHEFALNFNPSNPFCAGIEGLLDTYVTCLNQVQLYGPTNFAPIIYHVARFAITAMQELTARNYYILMIITDGAISDVEDTLKAIVYCSTLPMSIIIVGVGEADFGTMNLLDGDNEMLKDSLGNFARRDIVQFVPFREFKENNPEALARHVLTEVPRQLCEYFRLYSIVPGTGVVRPQAPLQFVPSEPGQVPQPTGPSVAAVQ